VLSGNGFASDPGPVIEIIEGELAGGPGALGSRPRGAAAGSRPPTTARGTRPRVHAARSAPRTVRRLARRIARMRRPLGIVARFGRGERRVVLRSDRVRFDGRVKLRPRVGRARR